MKIEKRTLIAAIYLLIWGAVEITFWYSASIANFPFKTILFEASAFARIVGIILGILKVLAALTLFIIGSEAPFPIVMFFGFIMTIIPKQNIPYFQLVLIVLFFLIFFVPFIYGDLTNPY
jgi:hypothetical protein